MTTHNQMYEQALESPASGIDLIINRPPDGDPELTFSVEALEAIRDAAMTWIGTRLMRRLKAGKPPQQMKAELVVTFDGEPPIRVPLSERPWFVIDGKHRGGE